MRLSKVKLLAMALFCLVTVVCLPLNGQAYYGGLYGGGMGGLYGSYGLGGLYGGMYGGLYGGLGGLYGGMYGGMYGGYGSLYGGLGGMYGGMYGGYGGLYGGLGGMYGGYGLYGGMYGGLYGSSLYGGMYGGLYGSSLYGGMLGRIPYSAGTTPLVTPARTSAALTGLTSTLLLSGGGGGLLNPTGTWSGTYLSYISLKGGICTMNLLYNTLTRTVSGTAGLLLNKLIPIPINVSGLYLASPFTLSGSFFDPVSLITYYEDLTCTLLTASAMTGTYLIHDALYLKSDTGNFNVSLTVAPVI
jgi:hypothetical protein